MKKLARALAQRIAGQVSTGLSLLGDRSKCGVGVLTYHRISPRFAGFEEPSINVTPQAFRRQLLGLQALGYEFWSLQRIVAHANTSAPFPGKIICVAFDDGYQSVYTEAWPVLRELKIPATIFLNTAYLGSDAPFPFDRWGMEHQESVSAPAYRPLTWGQCEEMHASGLIELGAHTHSHADFRDRPEDFEADLRMNIGILCERFGLEAVTFAFPFGRWRLGYVSEELLKAAKKTGVICALTTECELIHGGDPFGWGRFTIYDWDTPRTIAARLRGWYSWAPKWQDRIRGNGLSARLQGAST